jgi:Kef-type K+ transport system membrane component KefB
VHNLFFELTIIFILAGAAAFIVSLLKQPSIIAYIITGVIIGPLGYYRLSEGDVLRGLSELGITLLLFMVGLDLDIAQLKKTGKAAILAGLGQIVFTCLIGFGILKLLGFGNTASWYIALALTFSSTIIVVKLLNDKKDLQSLYGKLAVGVFLVQDIAAIFALIFLTSLSGVNAANTPLWENGLMTLVKIGVLAVIVGWHSVKVFPRILRYIGKSDELLLIFTLAWALGFSSFVSLPFIGLNLEIGGFLAGLALANTAVHHQISARIKSLRDFFIIIFFIVLGSQLVFFNIAEMLTPTIILALFVLIGNPLIILIILATMGYKPRTAFLTGVTVAQISEFSLILMALGAKLGHVNQTEVGIVTMIGVVTFAVSSYMILYADKLYHLLQPLIQKFDFRKGKAEKGLHEISLRNHIILVGAHRLGSHIIDTLIKQKLDFVIIDHNPEVTEHYESLGLNAICGDISDAYIQELAHADKAKLIISTVPNFHDNLTLVENIKAKKLKTKLIFAAQDEEEALYLYDKNIDYVLLPHFIGGIHLAKILEDRSNFASLKQLKQNHLKTLGVS